MHIDEITRWVKAEAAQGPPAGDPAEPDASRWPRQAALDVRDRYHVCELLGLENDVLVTTAYRCLLHREPDPAAGDSLQKLADGELSPVAFLGGLRFSAEGRRVGVTVRGLVPRLIYRRLQDLPVIGYLVGLAVTLLRLPSIRRDIARELDALKAGLAAKADHAALDRKAGHADLDSKADRSEVLSGQQTLHQALVELRREHEADRAVLADKVDRTELEQKADRSELLAYQAAVRYAELYFHEVSREIRDLLHMLENQLPAAAASEPVNARLAALDAARYDKLYLNFEALYRGTPQAVSASLGAYAGLLEPLRETPAPCPALDLGCGRGEMLHCLQQLGFAATGVDLNQLAVRSCREEGLQAVHADVLNFLAEVAAGSVKVITCLHLAEHLSADQLFRLLAGIERALAPGGMLLLETPNPRNLLVGAGDFYRDFTHNRPLFPDTLRFLLDDFGYVDTGIFFFADDKDAGRRLVPAAEVRFDELNDYLKVSRDYAVVGFKGVRREA